MYHCTIWKIDFVPRDDAVSPYHRNICYLRNAENKVYHNYIIYMIIFYYPKPTKCYGDTACLNIMKMSFPE